jgi:hypothetical protein
MAKKIKVPVEIDGCRTNLNNTLVYAVFTKLQDGKWVWKMGDTISLLSAKRKANKLVKSGYIVKIVGSWEAGRVV